MYTAEENEFYENLMRDLEASGLSDIVSPDKTDKAVRFYTLLSEENRRHNLTAIKTPGGAALLHFTDTLAAARLFPENATVLDIGCGGGFPTIPLAVFRPDLRFVACDATAKKTAFVKAAADALGLTNVSVLTGRAEDFAQNTAYREKFDVTTARAVAALPVLLELCLPFVRKNGICIALKGASAADEAIAARNAAKVLGGAMPESVALTVTDGKEPQSRTAVIVRKITATPAIYPRPYAKILKTPL